jgi:hypothetical protein
MNEKHKEFCKLKSLGYYYTAEEASNIYLINKKIKDETNT